MKRNVHRGYTWTGLIKNQRYAVIMIVWLLGVFACVVQAKDGEVSALEVLARVQAHEFHPLDNDNAMTTDRTLREHGMGLRILQIATGGYAYWR